MSHEKKLNVGGPAPHRPFYLFGHKFVGLARGAPERGHRDVVTVVGLNLIGAGSREINLRLQDVELRAGPSAVTRIGEPDCFRGLSDHLLRGLREFGRLLSLRIGAAHLDLDRELGLRQRQFGLLQQRTRLRDAAGRRLAVEDIPLRLHAQQPAIL